MTHLYILSVQVRKDINSFLIPCGGPIILVLLSNSPFLHCFSVLSLSYVKFPVCICLFLGFLFCFIGPLSISEKILQCHNYSSFVVSLSDICRTNPCNIVFLQIYLVSQNFKSIFFISNIFSFNAISFFPPINIIRGITILLIFQRTNFWINDFSSILLLF